MPGNRHLDKPHYREAPKGWKIMTTTTSPHPEQGQMVSVRSRNWMVTDVSASTLPPERLQTGLEPPQHLLTLSSVEDDGLGEELQRHLGA